MKNLWLCLTPTFFFAGSIVFLYVSPEIAGQWSAHSVFKIVPYILLGTAFLLGALFNQSWVSCLSALLMLSGVSLKIFALERFDEHVTRGILVFLYAFLPPIAVLLYRSVETGFFSLAGFRKLIMTTGIPAGVFLLAEINPFKALFYNAYRFFSMPTDGWMAVPFNAVLILCASAPLLFIKSGKFFTQGYFLLLTLEFILFGLSFRSPLWRSARGLPVLYVCLTGAGAILIYTVLENLWRNSAIDALTQLPNRRALEQRMAGLSGVFSIAVLDIDDFKKINDRYGHESGDQALRYLASHLAACKSGYPFRYGGEEFVVVFPKSDVQSATESMEQIRRTICGRDFVIRSKNRPAKKPRTQTVEAAPGQAVRITASIGVAGSSDNDTIPADVLRDADIAMYSSKAEGKNRVTGI